MEGVKLTCFELMTIWLVLLNQFKIQTIFVIKNVPLMSPKVGGISLKLLPDISSILT